MFAIAKPREPTVELDQPYPSQTDRGTAALRYLGSLWTRFSGHALLLFVALAVWWPDGFNIGPINDGWMGISDSSLLASDFSTRVLQVLPKAIGLMLTPGSFIGWQCLLLVLTVARGVLISEIVERLLGGQRTLAVACGLIAMFHPLDNFYFWIDASNVDMAYALGLGACLAALVHLQTNSRSSMLAVLLLQIACCFMYSGFLLILIGFPVGVWFLSRVDGKKVGAGYLLKMTLAVLLFMGFMAYEARFAHNREGRVADLSVFRMLKGYSFQIHALGASLMRFEAGAHSVALLPAVLTGLVAGGIIIGPGSADVRAGKSWRYYAVLILGLIVLAALAYLPYSISKLRHAQTRQMFAAGIFLFLAVMVPIFTWLSSYPAGRYAAASLLAVLAGSVVITGQEIRTGYVKIYRLEERLLSAIAEAVPQPPRAAFVVIRLQPGTAMRGMGGSRTGLKRWPRHCA